MFETRNNLFYLPKELAWAIQYEVNEYVRESGQKYAYTDQILKTIYAAVEVDSDAFCLGSQDELTIWEFVEMNIPQILYPSPILVVDNTYK